MKEPTPTRTTLAFCWLIADQSPIKIRNRLNGISEIIKIPFKCFRQTSREMNPSNQIYISSKMSMFILCILHRCADLFSRVLTFQNSFHISVSFVLKTISCENKIKYTRLYSTSRDLSKSNSIDIFDEFSKACTCMLIMNAICKMQCIIKMEFCIDLWRECVKISAKHRSTDFNLHVNCCFINIRLAFPIRFGTSKNKFCICAQLRVCDDTMWMDVCIIYHIVFSSSFGSRHLSLLRWLRHFVRESGLEFSVIFSI